MFGSHAWLPMAMMLFALEKAALFTNICKINGLLCSCCFSDDGLSFSIYTFYIFIFVIIYIFIDCYVVWEKNIKKLSLYPLCFACHVPCSISVIELGIHFLYKSLIDSVLGEINPG